MTLDEARNRVKELDSGSGFYSSDYEAGWEDALRRATEILDKVEPVGNPGKMTLKELAHELRRLFRFRYLTVEDYKGEGPECIGLWMDEPEFSEMTKAWVTHHCYLFDSFETSDLAVDLDLSEYKDENGEIDYSKCIVEVSDDIE